MLNTYRPDEHLDAAQLAVHATRVLGRMSDLLSDPRKGYGWTQRELAVDGNGFIVDNNSADGAAFCLLGARNRAIGDLYDAVDETHIAAQVEHEVSMRLRDAVNGNVPTFNDTPGRTRFEVVRAVRAARIAPRLFECGTCGATFEARLSPDFEDATECDECYQQAMEAWG